MRTLMIFFFVSLSVAQAGEVYILPKEIIIARDKVIASKRILDQSIEKSYFKLCQSNKHSEAQHIEFLAYRQITGLDCWQLVRM